jgi:hypothetical protein
MDQSSGLKYPALGFSAESDKFSSDQHLEFYFPLYTAISSSGSDSFFAEFHGFHGFFKFSCFITHINSIKGPFEQK